MSRPTVPQSPHDSSQTSRQQRNQQAQKVELWRECLTTLPDAIFFDLMRIYLGELKTPYNKQNLIQQLGAFLHKEQVQKTILMLLSPLECQMLTAVALLDHPNLETLATFFSDTLTHSQLNAHLMNLEERLVIYRDTSQRLLRQQPPFVLNPILEPLLQQRIHPAHLLPLPKDFQNQPHWEHLPQLSPSLLAAFYAFVQEVSDLCRQDGSLKKRVIQRLEQTFHFMFMEDTIQFFQTLVTSLRNLSLLKEEAKGFQPDYTRWCDFAQMPFHLQAAYLAAAACGRDTRSNLQRKASHFLALTELCPPEGFTQDVYLRLEFLIQHLNPQVLSHHIGTPPGGAPRSSAPHGGSRFARMMAAAEKKRMAQPEPQTQPQDNDSQSSQQEDHQEPAAEGTNALWCTSLFQAGTKLGIFRQTGTGCGIRENLQPVFHPHLPQEPLPVQEHGHLTLDSALTATLLPGLSLAQLLQIMPMLRLRRYDTAMTLEITKAACLQCYDQGLTPQSIQERLSRFLHHGLPQHLSVALEDWHHSYSRATLYKGYILHLKEKKDYSDHPVLSPHIVTELEAGIYLMDFANDQEAQEILAKAGFESSRSTKKAPAKTTAATFPQHLPEIPLDHLLKSRQQEQTDWQEQTQRQQQHLAQLQEMLAALDLPTHQMEGLQFRINRKILLVPEQLQGASVKMEQLEASGMDFVGKVHVAEQAINHKSQLRLTYLTEGQEPQILEGIPLEIQKVQGDCLVVLQAPSPQRIPQQGESPSLEDTSEGFLSAGVPAVATHSLSRAHVVRRIQGSIFATSQ